MQHLRESNLSSSDTQEFKSHLRWLTGKQAIPTPSFTCLRALEMRVCMFAKRYSVDSVNSEQYRQ